LFFQKLKRDFTLSGSFGTAFNYQLRISISAAIFYLMSFVKVRDTCSCDCFIGTTFLFNLVPLNRFSFWHLKGRDEREHISLILFSPIFFQREAENFLAKQRTQMMKTIVS